MTGNPPLDIAFRVGPFPKRSETFVLGQVEGLVARGHCVTVLADERVAGLAPPGGLASLRYTTGDGVFARLAARAPWRMREAMKRRAEKTLCARADAVVCNFGWFGQRMAESAGEGPRRAKIVTIYHGFDMSSTIDEAGRNPYEALFRRGDLHLPISRFWRDKLLAMGAPPERTQVHRMGVNLDTFAFSPRPPVEDRDFRFVTVGRFVEKKGLEIALRAMAALRLQRPQARFRFEIIGGGPLESKLKALAHDLSLGEKVEFLGERPHAEVAEALARADVFVLPSVVAADGDMEGVPVSLMEAMASGLPVISTRHSGIPELIDHGVSGLLAEERDVEGLARLLAETMEDPDGRARRAAAARAKVEAEFDNAKLNDALEAHCRALAGMRSA